MRRSRLLVLLLALTASCSDEPPEVRGTGAAPAGAAASSGTGGVGAPTSAAGASAAPGPGRSAEGPVATTVPAGTVAATAVPAPERTGHAGAPPTLAGLEGLSSLRVDSRPTRPGPAALPPGFVSPLVPVDGGSSHDFGALREGDPAVAEFLLVNQGDAAVAVRAINSTCKCTLGDVFLVADDGSREPYELERAIAPGQRLSVRAELETLGQRGAMAHAVNLLLVQGGATRLELKARVEPFLDMDPPSGTVQIGTLRRDETRTGSVSVRTADGSPVGLFLREGEVPEHLRPRLVPLAPEADGRSAAWRLEVTVGPDLPEVVRQPWALLLYTDVPLPGGAQEGAESGPSALGAPTVFTQRVVVAATVMPSVRVQPSHVALGVFAPRTPQQAEVQIEVTDDHRFAAEPVVRVEWGPSRADTAALATHLTTELIALDEGTDYLLRVRLDGLPPDLSGPFQGTLVVETDHPERPKLEIPFSGLCRDTQAPGAGR